MFNFDSSVVKFVKTMGLIMVLLPILFVGTLEVALDAKVDSETKFWVVIMAAAIGLTAGIMQVIAREEGR